MGRHFRSRETDREQCLRPTSWVGYSKEALRWGIALFSCIETLRG
jgi:hypothetical protein